MASRPLVDRTCEQCAVVFGWNGSAKGRFCSKHCCGVRAVRSEKPLRRDTRERFEELTHPEPNSGCWLWAGLMSDLGYGRFFVDGGRQQAHRVAWEMFRGPIPDGMKVCHHCDNRACVNPGHLFIGTQAENVNDMMAKGRGVSKLSVEDVRAIRAESATGERQAKIAARFGVCQSAISAIVRRRVWAHVPDGRVPA